MEIVALQGVRSSIVYTENEPSQPLSFHLTSMVSFKLELFPTPWNTWAVVVVVPLLCYHVAVLHLYVAFCVLLSFLLYVLVVYFTRTTDCAERARVRTKFCARTYVCVGDSRNRYR